MENAPSKDLKHSKQESSDRRCEEIGRFSTLLGSLIASNKSMATANIPPYSKTCIHSGSVPATLNRAEKYPATLLTTITVGISSQTARFSGVAFRPAV
jgi:hypothetical protein